VKVLVTGGTGFVGSRIVRELRARNVEVRVLSRSAGGDVTDAAAVTAAAAGCTHVVHLVAIIRGARSDFERVMVAGTRNVIAAAQSAGVERFVLMSALGVDERTRTLTPYFAAKWQMEQDVIASGLEHVIFRPSFVFAARGRVLPTFVRKVRYSPVVTVIGSGRCRLQPIWIDDVAAYFAAALDLPGAANRAFDIGGPDEVSWDELYSRIAKALGKRRAFVHVPAGVARAGARLTEWIPGSPLTADQVTMLESGDNVVRDTDAADTFGLPLVSLDEQIDRVKEKGPPKDGPSSG